MRALLFLAAAASLCAPAIAQKTPGAPDPCKLFKPVEIASYLDELMENGTPDTLTTSCSWYATSEESNSFAMLTIWPKSQADTPHLTRTMKAHPELGEGGYAIKDWNTIGSWTGGVVLGDHFYRVFLNGPKATEADIVAWLQAAKTRKG